MHGHVTAAVVAAAGSSRRMGSNKLLADLAGEPVLRTTVRVVTSCRSIGRVFVCVPPGHEETYRTALGALADRVELVAGGESRTATVYRGLVAADRSGAGRVVVHDGARPLAPVELLYEVLLALDGVDGVVPGLPVADTVKEVDAGLVSGTVDRSGKWLIQTPQAFLIESVLAAHRWAADSGREATDDAGLVEQWGGTVRVIEGDRRNIKLTTPPDLDFAVRLISRETDIRIGLGVDIHPLVPGRRLIVGGVDIPHHLGLQGHSDADAVTHAVIDGLLGAVGLPDIGVQFPDTDETYRGACSLDLLSRVCRLAQDLGYAAGSVDITVLADQPKLAPYRTDIINSLSDRLGLSPDRVSLKATTTERVGRLHENPGIIAWALVTVRKITY